ncbi:ribosome biogenesis protein SLX9 [Nitzschia inconspicua]|uniref:Ribosome biogenesis protein SLX9 n=1 Tax=Nitzschia inconspicua TaxID=303405 RepID=A0A9K3KT04_9STRA|nr:ribosome biogenesis protein SLX9 [Nitzschia inconspicua]
MPKVSRNAKLIRKARRVAASDPLAGGPKEEDVPAISNETRAADDATKDKDDIGVTPSQQLSRGQRKRMAKRENFFRKEQLILSSLKLKRDEEQKRRIDGLDAIREALLSTTSDNIQGDNSEGKKVQAPPPVTTNKAKRRLVATELEHLSLVLQHPAYKQDPFATMQEHLRNTLAKERQQLEAASKHRMQQEKSDREEKLRLKKEAGLKRRKSKKKYKPRRTK